jgi:hypothetical protein
MTPMTWAEVSLIALTSFLLGVLVGSYGTILAMAKVRQWAREMKP